MSRAIRRGDADQLTFRALFDAHHDAVRAYAARRVPADDVDDVVAEAFVAVWRRCAHRPSHDELSWVLGMARGAVANRRRSRRRWEALRVRLAMQPRDLGGDGEVSQRVLTVRAAMAALRERDREVLMLVVWDELTHAQAAAVLGCSVGAVGVRLHRARVRLRTQLDHAVVGVERAQGFGGVVEGHRRQGAER
ncbi:RNA polymerase sigma factor [Frankia gtarii]|uniref:RNA polymerase sigma factor n=1 Tax=Frankia gtarii TaxID=2950102 RepID=UPI0021C031B6|nr:RNA polymerase sigma factor [Frankia gtarii]